jgi:hypothetical protein
VSSVERYANDPIETDHGQLKHPLWPMRSLRTDRTAQVGIAGHAFVQYLRRGHYELDSTPSGPRLATAFTKRLELAAANLLRRTHIPFDVGPTYATRVQALAATRARELEVEGSNLR